MAPQTSHHTLPPFAEGVETAPLVSISLAKLEANDADEQEAFWKASKELGFFYMSMEGSQLGEQIVAEAEKLHKLQKEFAHLPNEVKESVARVKFEKEGLDSFFGYRLFSETPDANGVPQRDENYNMRKDDFVGNVKPLPCPDLIKKNWELLQSYTLNCRRAIDLMFSVLDAKLELPQGTLYSLHRLDERSGDHVRFNKKAPAAYDEEKAKGGEHTDFGSLTILFNWLGGLQIRLPDAQQRWVYVKPIPGSAVVNLGDALVKFTAGLLRSNIHRVVPPAAPQDAMDRYSLVYFSRPEDAVVLRRLRGGIIDAQPVADTQEPEMTSEEWILRRSVGDLKGVYTHKGGLELRRMAEGRVGA